MKQGYSSWMLIRDKLVATIGQDPNVCVHSLEHIECEKYCIRISVRGRAKAEALRKITPKEYKFGNVIVNTVFYESNCEITESYCPANAKQIANILCIALQGNYLFEAVALPEEGNCILPTVYALIVPKYIRLWGECGMTFEELAPNLFAEVLRIQYGLLVRVKVLFTIYDRCDIGPRDIYCINHQDCSYKHY